MRNRLWMVVAVACLTAVTASVQADWTQGFEIDAEGWFDAARVSSSTGGIDSADGSWHGEVAGGAFTRWGGYSDVFPSNGYITSVDIYLDVDAGYANDSRFDFSSAINGSDGAHQRDFAFNGGFYNDEGLGNRFVVSASTGAPGWPKNPARNPLTLSATGWYSFQNTFYDDGAGVLAVDLSVIDASGTTLSTWTLSEASDVISQEIGGNRYGWLVQNTMSAVLAIDNATLMIIPPAPVSNVTQGTVFYTIQAAIDAANAGDTIEVAAGTYNESPKVTKSLTIQSADGAAATNIVLGGANYLGALTINAVDVKIDGFTITGYDAVGSGLASTNIYVMAGSNNTEIANCRMLVGATGAGSNGDDGFGLLTPYGGSVQITGLNVHDNVIEPVATTGARAFYINPGIDGFVFNQNVISGEFAGTSITQSLNGVVSNNTLNGTGSSAGFGTWGYPDAAAGHGATQFVGNTISGTSKAIAIYNTNDVVIEGNTLTGNVLGVLVTDAYGPFDVSTIEIHNNNISGNSTAGVQNDATAVVDADNNWWGAADGPSGEGPGSGDAVSVNVSFAPWMTVPDLDYVLVLLANDASLYIKPTEIATINMDALNLVDPVTGCQAVLNFSSFYFGTEDAEILAGGGIWDEMIYQMVETNGDLDVAVGVDLQAMGGTTADGTVATMKLTPTGEEGVTQVVFRDDVSAVEMTVFSDLAHQFVYPGAKVDSQMIVIDGTAPLAFDAVVDAACTTGEVSVTFATTDALAGIDYYELIVDGNNTGAAMSPAELMLEEGDHTIQVKAFDKAGNVTDSSVANVSVDASGPAIASVTATQAGADVLCPAVATQGVVSIDVTVADSGCSALVQPTVAVAGMGPVSFVEVNGDVYTYEVEVVSTTENGSHTITVTAVDGLGNETVNTDSAICVDKNQVDGVISMVTLATADYGFDRDVVFVATDASGTALKSWTQTLSFTNAAGTATANYSLLEVPGTMAGLSAKATLTLRTKEAAAVDDDGQAVVDIAVVGGDLNDTNDVNILDYSLLKVNWMSFGEVAPADINGDGEVNILDYSLLKDAWFTTGDAE